jgi:DNA helicase II / ATP-dependent DNA helicase PcrA
MFEEMEPRWLSPLNSRQREAATAPADAPLLILAGAGTGKTATLCSRVAWLVSGGMRAERILVITFTRRAARELVARANALLGGGAGAGRVVGGTFHSVAHRLLRAHAEALGLAAGFTVLDASDTADLLDVVREEHGVAAGRRRFPRKATLADILSRTLNAQRPVSEIVAESFPWCADHVGTIADIFRGYVERKRRAEALDLDDLMLYWRALVTHPALGPRVAGLFDHVLVDEYQDVNSLQASVAAGLCTSHRGLTVVGDDMQAIFGFRAAEPRHILDFPAAHPDVRVVALERNYRATQPLLDAANAVAAAAHGRERAPLVANHTGGRAPTFHPCRDEAQEAALVADAILAAHEEGHHLRDQAVLMRAGHHSATLELELARRDVPFVKYGGIRYLEAAHVKDYVAAVRVAVNPRDSVSWFRLLQLLEGVGPGIARRVVDALEASPEQGLAVAWADAATAIPGEVRGQADALVAALAPDPQAETAGTHAELLLQALTPLVRGRYPDAEARLPDLRRLADAAAAAADLESFAADLVLDPPRSSADFAGPPGLDEDFVVLSTIHSAKGLEWEVVHLIHASDGNLPSDMALASPEGLEEERRLLYVAVTRPRRALHVYSPLRYYHRPSGRDDAHGYGKRSRFLDETVLAAFTVCEPPAETLDYEPAVTGDAVELEVEALLR